MKVGHALRNTMNRKIVTLDAEAVLTEEGKITGIVMERDIMRVTLDVFRKLSDAWV